MKLSLISFCLGLILSGAAFAQTVAETPPKDRPPQLTLSLDHNRDEVINGLRLSPDESILFTWDDRQVRTWDMLTGKSLKTVVSLSNEAFRPERIEDVRVAKRRGQLLISKHSGLVAIGLDRLHDDNVAEKSVFEYLRLSRFVYDETRDRVYAAVDASAYGFSIKELDIDKESFNEGVRVTLVDRPQKHSVVIEPRQMELRADGRIFVSYGALGGGFVIVNPETGVIDHRHASAQPDVERGYYAGPDDTVICTWREGAFARIQVLGGADFGVLRETRVVVGERAGLPVFSEAGSYDPKTGRLLLTVWRHAPIMLDFASLNPVVAPRPSNEPVELSNGMESLYVASRDEWLVAAVNRVVGYDPARRKVTRNFGVAAMTVDRLVASPTGREWLVMDAIRGSVTRVRLHVGGVEVTQGQDSGVIDGAGVAYSPDGTRIAIKSNATGDGVAVMERDRFPVAERVLKPRDSARWSSGWNNLYYSPDGRLIASHGSYLVSVLNQQGDVVFSKNFGRHIGGQRHELATFSPDCRTLIAVTPGPALTAYDIASGKELWTQKTADHSSLLFYVGDDVFASYSGRDLEYRSSADGQVLFTTSFHAHRTEFARAISPDRKLLAVNDGNFVRVFDAETGDEVFAQWTSRRLTALTFLADNRTLVGAGEDQLQRLWDVKEKRELATLALFKGNTDWVLSTPDLRFDGAEAALGQLYLVKSGAVLPLESMFEKLHTPRLAASLFDAEAPVPAPVDVNALAFAPVARIELLDGARNLTVEDDVEAKTSASSRVRVRVNAVAKQSQVAEIRLYQNGKLVQATTRNLTVEDDEPMDGESAKTFELELTPGENLFRAVAINAQRTESAPAELAVVYAPAKTDPGTVAGSTGGGGLRLHVLIVGINAYKNPRHRLNYAVADANAIGERLRERASGIFTDVRVTSLIDTQADKAGITGALRAVAAEAGARDVFVFYYAGHGVMSGDGGAAGDFFLVPYDVTQLYGADEQLAAKALSSKELLEFSKTIPAQKQLFLLDACQSAGALQTVAMRGAAEEKAIAQLARSSGTHWITASGSEQFATEFDQLGHGAFTYALLDGLLGKGDNGDGRVTVNELKAWLESQVPELTHKYKGTPQYPASYGYGQDFPVGVVTAAAN